jgi:adenine deaminase
MFTLAADYASCPCHGGCLPDGVRELEGAIVVVNCGRVVGELALPIAGLLSKLCGSEVAKIQQQLVDAMKTLGCSMPSPLMTLSFITLIFISDYGITDIGNVKLPFYSPCC